MSFLPEYSAMGTMARTAKSSIGIRTPNIGIAGEPINQQTSPRHKVWAGRLGIRAKTAMETMPQPS